MGLVPAPPPPSIYRQALPASPEKPKRKLKRPEVHVCGDSRYAALLLQLSDDQADSLVEFPALSSLPKPKVNSSHSTVTS